MAYLIIKNNILKAITFDSEEHEDFEETEEMAYEMIITNDKVVKKEYAQGEKTKTTKHCYCDDDIIIIPDGVTSIGKEVFCDCENIKEVKIPDSVNSIGEYAFYNCKSIKEIKIPEGVKSIQNCTFGNC